MGKDLPEHDWFWPIYKNKEKAEFDEVQQIKTVKRKLETLVEEIEEEESRYFYANGSEAPEEINFYELEESELQNRYFYILEMNQGFYF